MFTKIQALINREIQEENEPKETAVLVRVLCLIDILFLTIGAVDTGVVYGCEVCIPASLLILLMVGVFGLSYKVKMKTLVPMYFVALSINCIVLVLLLGLSFMFQAQFYVLFIIFFYRGAGTKLDRVGSVFISSAILLFLIFYIRINGSIIDVDLSKFNVLTFFCTAYILAKTTCFAYFFRRKFSASEEKIIKYSKKLEMLATTDPLTKLQNRRGMLNHIEEYSSEIMSNGGMLTVAIGDIDYFKHINDTYGHDAGDYVLETLAKIMNEFMDGKGMVARWGGEEFLFSLENINGDYAFEEISKLLHLIEKYEFSFDGTPIKVTMTFGLEEYDDNIGIDKVITKADEKLYLGKEQGRNRVIY
ncbi:MAG: GGDEF domain-containing protein [Lachnospiraceae bacterium]|nr:GGDEF domain-containing protein [Lachnospiraceae bacterium]